MSATVTRLTPQLGVEITGLSGRDLMNRDAADACLGALHEYGVVVYRDAHIDDDDLVAFSRLLGEVAVTPTGEHEYPEIQTITLDPAKTNSQLAAYRQGNFLWHIDGATSEIPQKGTLLSAHEVDEAGGDTEFASTYAAYNALPAPEQAEIEELCVLHSFAAAQHRANPNAPETERAAWSEVPTRVHPLVWTHQDGRKSLLLGATAAEVVGLPPAEGRALLDRLLDWSIQPQFVLRHHWRRGDLVTWDNTGMLHRALPFDPTSPRLLHRTTLLGEEVVA
jgi:alpha-ketoglutarate-dependent taurine dioxygenase